MQLVAHLQSLRFRPSAPKVESTDLLQHNDDIITTQNHPIVNSDFEKRFNPSFIGKTWGEMKQMEANRDYVDFFTSNDLDQNLQFLYRSLTGPKIYFPDFDSCVHSWRSKSSIFPKTLNLSYVNKRSLKSNLIKNNFPSGVYSLTMDHYAFALQLSIKNKLALTALNIKSKSKDLDVMPYVQVLIWNVEDIAPKYDFSEWVNLRILIILNVSGKSKFKLPFGLVSLSVFKRDNYVDETFEDVFTYKNKYDCNHNKSVFQTLKHISIKRFIWKKFPDIPNCTHIELEFCSSVEAIEAPSCRVLKVSNSLFNGFGPFTQKNNKVLDTVILHFIKPFGNTIFHFPPGSPKGYRHIDILHSQISCLPTRFIPFAFLSIIDAGSYLYINDIEARENLAFYYDHEKLSPHKTLEENLPKGKESLYSMVDRKYGFNWPKFATKIQRQYRFKKYIQNLHQNLLTITNISNDVCKYSIANLLGASDTFSLFKR